MNLPGKGSSKKLNHEFEAFAMPLARKVWVKRAGQILGEGDLRIWRVLFTYKKAAYV
jgi:hypothetical protein